MKNTIIALIVLFLMLPSLAYGAGELGEDRYKAMEKGRITHCWAIYYKYTAPNNHEGLVCDDIFKKIQILQWERHEQKFRLKY